MIALLSCVGRFMGFSFENNNLLQIPVRRSARALLFESPFAVLLENMNDVAI